MEKETYQKRVEEKMSSLEVGDSFDTRDFVTENWGVDTFFTRRIFDVYLCKARKEFRKLDEPREFKRKGANLVRLK